MDIPAPIPAKPTRFLDQLRSFIRSRNLAYITEKTYVAWIKRYIRFNGLRHRSELESAEVMRGQTARVRPRPDWELYLYGAEMRYRVWCFG